MHLNNDINRYKAVGLSNMSVSETVDFPVDSEIGHVVANKFRVIGQKRRGVEPGVICLKAWTEKDDESLSHPKGKMHKAALEKFTEGEIKNKRKKVINHLIENHGKFQKKHFIKMNYKDPVVGEYVGPDVSQCLGTPLLNKIPIISSIARRIHQLSKFQTRREKNLSSVKEALANDLYQAMGVKSQKLKIIKSKYTDGTTKLILDGTEAKGKNGEAFHTFKDQIQFGYLPGNHVLENPDAEQSDSVEIDEQELAKVKIKAGLLGDWDKVGISGENIGYIVSNGKAHPMNIDPGKALDIERNSTVKKTNSIFESFKNVFHYIKFFLVGKTDVMSHQNLRPDTSVSRANCTLWDMLGPGYTNFTLFDDTKLSDRIEGMRDIENNWDSLMNIFDEYEACFNNGDLNFKKELQDARKKLTDRKDYFHKVLEDRLKLSNDEIDAVDCVEKLVSRTFTTITDGQVTKELKYMQVADGERSYFKVEEEENSEITLSHTPFSIAGAGGMVGLIESYLGKGKPIQVSEHDGQVIIKGNKKALTEAFTEEKVKNFKEKQGISQTLMVW